MPSLSTTSCALPLLPPASSARASNRNASPGATGSDTGTVACQVPDCGVPPVRVAGTPLTLSADTPTMSLACMTTDTVAAETCTSVDGDVTCTVGATPSRTITSKLPEAALPAVSVAEQITDVIPIAKPLPATGEQLTPPAPPTVSVAVTG